MHKPKPKKLILLLIDIAILYLALFFTLFLKGGANEFGNLSQYTAPFTWIYAFWILVFYSAGMYDWPDWPPTRRYYTLNMVIKTMVACSVLAVGIFYFVPAFSITPKTTLIFDAAVSAALLWLSRQIFIRVVSKRSKIKILFFGSSPEINEFAKYINEKSSLGYYVELTLDHLNSDHESIKTIILQKKIDLVIVSQDISQNRELVKMFYQVLPLGVTIMNFPDFYESVTGKVPVSLINETWFLENLIELGKGPYEFAKRVLDIIAALFLSIPVIVLFPIVSLLIKIESPGPIFYRQRRVGKNGGTFEFIKFRSMTDGADNIDVKTIGENDERHTLIGKILRNTYLDELPQIINIFRGEMSFVGPRPERPEYVDVLRNQIPFYEIRLLVRPGITGWAQISMPNDASVEDAPEKLQYDLYYIKNRSFFMDIAIMLKTASLLVRRTGR